MSKLLDVPSFQNLGKQASHASHTVQKVVVLSILVSVVTMYDTYPNKMKASRRRILKPFHEKLVEYQSYSHRTNKIYYQIY